MCWEARTRLSTKASRPGAILMEGGQGISSCHRLLHSLPADLASTQIVQLTFSWPANKTHSEKEMYVIQQWHTLLTARTCPIPHEDLGNSLHHGPASHVSLPLLIWLTASTQLSSPPPTPCPQSSQDCQDWNIKKMQWRESAVCLERVVLAITTLESLPSMGAPNALVCLIWQRGWEWGQLFFLNEKCFNERQWCLPLPAVLHGYKTTHTFAPGGIRLHLTLWIPVISPWINPMFTWYINFIIISLK